MTTDIVLKSFFAIIYSLILAWFTFSKYDLDLGTESSNTTKQKYLPIFNSHILLLFLCVVIIIASYQWGLLATMQMVLPMCFGIFLHISIYYMILIPLLPFFRRHISARTCVLLWLIPNFLYMTQQDVMAVQKPLLVIPLPGKLVWILFYVWLTGFLAVLIWKIFSHLIFRAAILKDAYDVGDTEILKVWNQEIEQANIKNPNFELVVSPNIAAPLSIGLFQRTTKVVLPKRSYAPEELSLILRHEIVHICRRDAVSKFFLIFCTAMCWFNPLMWIAMRKIAEDIELSCDETVLLESDQDIRRQYAHLLLTTASDERGFTTCLSSSAESMRYRLKHVIEAPKRHSGALLVGLISFILFMSCGSIALTYGSSTGTEVIYNSQDTSKYPAVYTSLGKCSDSEKLHNFMKDLTLQPITGTYSISGYEKQITLIYNTPNGNTEVVLTDNILRIAPLDRRKQATRYYYLPDGVDWKYLNEIIS